MRIFVTTTFEALHEWPQAPQEVSFLRHPHRHVFHVRLDVDVNHDDRDLEFFTIKKILNDYIRIYIGTRVSVGSCEQIAKKILKGLKEYHSSTFKNRGMACRVSEDGENGAVVFMTPEGEIE